MEKLLSIREQIKAAEKKLAGFDRRRKIVLDRLERLHNNTFSLSKGNGGIFKPNFSCGVNHDSVEAELMLTIAMRQRPELGFDSYDRFFPSQDTMPKGGFGNLIALPLQKEPREEGNTFFVDDEFVPHKYKFACSTHMLAFKGIQLV
jgi:hypothetical protein